MRVERQGKSECMLATIAALSGRSLAEVRSIACRHAGVRVWHSVFRRPIYARVLLYSHAVTATAREIDPTGMLAKLIGRDFGYATVAASVRLIRTPEGLPDGELPKRGRGVVVIRGRGANGHISPWENGMVYDSNWPEHPCFLYVFVARYRGFKIQYVTWEEAPAQDARHFNPEDCPDYGDLGF